METDWKNKLNRCIRIINKEKKQMSETNLMMAILTISGGLQDAYSYFIRGEVFANAQTGNIVLMSKDIFTGDWGHFLKYLIPLMSFMLGVFVAAQVRRKYQYRKKIHWRQWIVLLEIILLFIVGNLPTTIHGNMLGNALTSFACAMQVQSFRKVNGIPYASTMCIGNMRGGIASLSMYIESGKESFLKQALQYFSVIFLFAIGAGIGGVFYTNAGAKMIWISCVLLTIALLLMFIKEEQEEEIKKELNK